MKWSLMTSITLVNFAWGPSKNSTTFYSIVILESVSLQTTKCQCQKKDTKEGVFLLSSIYSKIFNFARGFSSVFDGRPTREGEVKLWLLFSILFRKWKNASCYFPAIIFYKKIMWSSLVIKAHILETKIQNVTDVTNMFASIRLVLLHSVYQWKK